ncbi:sn-glycerol-3-phosphate ABC transporter ATP-binding protein UgpC [Clostridiaceae bacterium HSG29]|nr:sn-glycerol-3-phosphate ABC transporter ATP-binding protein UgpC [Clostridiaceae bacterium HSG29]
MANVKLEKINKVYPNGFRAIESIDLDIVDKEFMVLVGPSGCGKTTTLRMIAGLEEITAGKMFIGDTQVNDIAPKDRDIAMVFQNYALYPHMTVYDNMAFGLKLRKFSKKEIDERVTHAADILGIEPLLSRKPKQLSGGQRQRVALGRAIVRNPKVFLMDEPLSNLDAKLRVEMRAELSKLHHDLDTTFVYVTHDQTEAMTMGTRICIMYDGYIQQVDDPQTIYDSPKNKFVAEFIGSPQMNFMDATLVEENGKVYAKVYDRLLELNEDKANIVKEKNYIGKEVLLGARPEHAVLDDDGIKAKVEVTELLGSETYVYSKAEGNAIVVRIDPDIKVDVDQEISFKFRSEKVHLFDKETELNICK